jgi:hypothetical protein
MSLAQDILALIGELERVHPGGEADPVQLPRGEFPNFVTAKNGRIRYFTPPAIVALRDVARLLYANGKTWKKVVERNEFFDRAKWLLICMPVTCSLALSRKAEGARSSSCGQRSRRTLANVQRLLNITFPRGRSIWNGLGR